MCLCFVTRASMAATLNLLHPSGRTAKGSNGHSCSNRILRSSFARWWPICSSSVRATRTLLIVGSGKRRHDRHGAGSEKGPSGRQPVPKFDPLYADGSLRVECPVPWEQQPVNEYQLLLQSSMFPWAAEDVGILSLRLAAIGVVVSGLLGWPVATLSISPEEEPWRCGLGAVAAGVVAATLTALRLYIGWSHVANRLLSATVEYEESGWYDGEVWVKPREVLSRDRLVGVHEVKPVITRLKGTLTILGLSLASCVAVILILKEAAPVDLRNFDNAQDSGSFGSPYSDASARHFEPEAFGDENEQMLQPLTLHDFCH